MALPPLHVGDKVIVNTGSGEMRGVIKTIRDYYNITVLYDQESPWGTTCFVGKAYDIRHATQTTRLELTT